MTSLVSKFGVATLFVVAIGFSPREASAQAQCYSFPPPMCQPGCGTVFASYPETAYACLTACSMAGGVSFWYDAAIGPSSIVATPGYGGCGGAPQPPPPPPPPPVEKTVIYLHGRGSRSFPGCAADPTQPPSGTCVAQLPAYPGLPTSAAGDTLATINATWPRFNPSYHGGDVVMGSSEARMVVRTAIVQKCTGGKKCIIVCHSAGCLRALMAFWDIRSNPELPYTAEQRALDGLQWTFAIGSAAGGSELVHFYPDLGGAEDLILQAAQAIGPYFMPTFDFAYLRQPIDPELAPEVLRSAAWSAVQDASPKPMYHLAGTKDLCFTADGIGSAWVDGYELAVKAMCGDATKADLKNWLTNMIQAPLKELRFCGNEGLTTLVKGVRVKLRDSPLRKAADGMVALHSTLGYRQVGDYHTTTTDPSKVYANRVQLPIQADLNHQTLLGVLQIPPPPENAPWAPVAPGDIGIHQWVGILKAAKPCLDIISQYNQAVAGANACQASCQSDYYYSTQSGYMYDQSNCPWCATANYLTQCSQWSYHIPTGTCAKTYTQYYLGMNTWDCYGCGQQSCQLLQLAGQWCYQACMYGYSGYCPYGSSYHPMMQECIANALGWPIFQVQMAANNCW